MTCDCRLPASDAARGFPRLAVQKRYGEQDPVVVAAELATAAEVIAADFDDIAPGQWQRTGTRRDGADFTIESFGRYFIHDPVHHLYDVTGTR